MLIPKEQLGLNQYDFPLNFSGNIRIRHVLEMFAQDIGPEEIKSKVTHPLEGIKVAPYYGCQILRPRKDHEETENPRYFEELLSTPESRGPGFACHVPPGGKAGART